MRRLLLFAAVIPVAACIDFRSGAPCGTDADCDGYLCQEGKCVSARGGGGIAASFRIDSLPDHAKAGAPVDVKIVALDAAGNVVQNFTGQVALTSTDARAALPANPSFTAGQAQAAVTFKTAGTQTLTATQPDKPSATGSARTQVGPGDAASYSMSPATVAPHAGVAFRIDLSAVDAFGNAATGYAGTASLQSTDPQAQLPGNLSFSAGGASALVTLRTAGSQSVTAHDVTAAAVTGAAAVAVAGGEAASFAAAGPQHATAGQPALFTVTARDAFGNTAALYSGAAGITATDGAALVPAGAAFTGGTSAVSVTFKTAGAQTVTFKDPGNSTLSATAGLIVDAAGASTFTVSDLPASVTAGTQSTFTLTARDAFGNLVTSYAGTVALSSSDPKAVFPAATVSFSPGSGTVHNVAGTLKTAGAQTLIATDTASHFSGSGSLQVNPGPFVRGAYAFVTQPSNVLLKATMSPAPQFAFLDAYGNYTTTNVSYPSSMAWLQDGAANSAVSAAYTSSRSGAIVTLNGLAFNNATALPHLQLQLEAVASAQFDVTAPWLPVSTPNVVGTPYRLAPSFIDPAGAVYAGNNRSTDEGATWKPLGATLTGGTFYSASGLTPLAAGTGVLLASELAEAGNSGTFSTYLVRSGDGGATWAFAASSGGATDSLSGLPATAIGVVPGAPETIIVAGAHSIPSSFNFRYKILKSVDGGATVTDVSANLSGGLQGYQGDVLQLQVDPATHALYLLTGTCGMPPGGANASPTPCQLWTSTDGATSWTALSMAGLVRQSCATGAAATYDSVGRVFPVPGGGVAANIVYGNTCGGQTGAAAIALHSSAGWGHIPNGDGPQLLAFGASSSEWFATRYGANGGVVDPLAHSTDAGSSWTSISLGLPSVESLLFLPDAWLALTASQPKTVFRTTTQGR